MGIRSDWIEPPAHPPRPEFDLLRDAQRIVELDPEIADRAFVVRIVRSFDPDRPAAAQLIQRAAA